MARSNHVLKHCSNHPKKICFLILVLGAAFMANQAKNNNTSSVPKAAEILKTSRRVQQSNVTEEFLSTVDRRANGRWYNFSASHFRFYAYSAFYDDRSSLLSWPVIRIVAVSDSYKRLKGNAAIRLYCVLHYAGNDVVTSMSENPMPIGFGWPLNGLEAKEYIYSCPTMKGTVPLSVSVANDKDENYLQSGVPVVVSIRKEQQRDFCVCVQAVYGSLDPYRLIEWMELQRILGVSLVGVYVLSAPEDVLKVFGHYSDEKFVDLRRIDYIYSSRKNDAEFWLHLTPAINDCIYRHMYEFRRIVVIDFDEIIMPRKHRNLTQLVGYLEQLTDVPNFAFRNNYFFLDRKADRTESKYLTFLRYRHKVAVSRSGYSSKSIINPEACTHMHNHLCWGVTANYTPYGNVLHILPSIALNQHYKRCHFDSEKCEAMMAGARLDDIMMRYKTKLTKRVNRKLEQIMGHGLT